MTCGPLNGIMDGRSQKTPLHLGGITAMNIQIFGKSKCFDTKKAERWFKERRVKFQSIDVKNTG